MEKEQIVRDDFPSARKGWDPAAVRKHLWAVAESYGEGARGGSEPSLADVAAARVSAVIAAAEATAAELRSEAQEAADRLLTEAREESEGLLERARAESEELVARAREEADARVEQARSAVGSLVSQADELRARVGTLGEELAGTIRSSSSSSDPDAVPPKAEVPGPVVVPEPTPPTIPEPTPDPVPEPTPDPVPDPVPEPVPEPSPDLPDDPGPLEPPAPEPDPEPPAADSAVASTDDLIAQLRGADEAPNGTAPNGTAPGALESDQAAARLVAMNMALDGSSREEIEAKLRADFGSDADLDGVLDDVLARASS